MTTPALPRPSTYAEALAAASAARAALTPATVVTAVAEQLAESVIATRERAADWAARTLLLMWSGVDPYSGADVAQFAAEAAQQMATAQTAVARAAAGAQKQSLAAMGIVVPADVTNPIDVRGARVRIVDGTVVLDRGGDARVEYGNDDTVVVRADDMTTEAVMNRPARAHRWAESQGADPDTAAQAAIDRLDVIIEDNLMLAQRLAEAEMLAKAVNLDAPRAPVIGYRRIIHPELSRTGVCGLCLAASDRIYNVETLRPIHDRCKCTVAAVTTRFDPADELNKVDLQRLYGEAGGTSGVLLKRTRYQVSEHGELGPVLKPAAGYKPRGARGKNAAAAIVPAAESKADIARRNLPIFEQNLAALRASGLAADAPQITYHEKQIARFRRDLAV